MGVEPSLNLTQDVLRQLVKIMWKTVGFAIVPSLF